MTEVCDLRKAIDIAESTVDQDGGATGSDSSRQDATALIAGYVHRLREGEVPWEKESQGIAGYLRLAELLLASDERKLSADLADLTLRNMEVAEMDGPVYEDPELWNQLGTLLAEQGDADRAKACLMCALNRAHQTKSQEDRSIVANLSAISLQLGDLRAADAWAARAAELLAHDWEADLGARLTLDRVRLDLARARDDQRALGTAQENLAESGARYVQREDADPSLALAISVALAATRHEADPGGPALAELELLDVSAQVTLGLDHRETILAQATLAAAEFDAAGGWSGTRQANNARTKAAVETFDDAATRAMTSPALGQNHPQTRILRTRLAEMRAAITPTAELPYRIDHVYLPDQSDARNEAKQEALAQEEVAIRLVAHGGASYLLEKNNLFYGAVIDALNRGVHVHVVITNPWNSLASHLPKDEKADPANHTNIGEYIENSTYYRKTFRPVTESFQWLKKRYPGLIELRLTNVDISASILLTSDTAFVESYITSNPEGRTGKGIDFQESEFGRDSRFYFATLKQFMNQWGLSSTWEEFVAHQEAHKDTLRSEMEAHDYVRVRESVRRGEVPRP